jgi:hypothetical protein
VCARQVLTVSGVVGAPHVEEGEAPLAGERRERTRLPRDGTAVVAHRPRWSVRSRPAPVELGREPAARSHGRQVGEVQARGERREHGCRRPRAAQASPGGGDGSRAVPHWSLARSPHGCQIPSRIDVREPGAAVGRGIEEEVLARQQRPQRGPWPGPVVASHGRRRVAAGEEGRLAGGGLRQPGDAQAGIERRGQQRPAAPGGPARGRPGSRRDVAQPSPRRGQRVPFGVVRSEPDTVEEHEQQRRHARRPRRRPRPPPSRAPGWRPRARVRPGRRAPGSRRARRARPSATRNARGWA